MNIMDNPVTQIQTASIESSPCPGEPLIEMVNIVKTFKSAAGEFTALKGVNACFYPGQFVSVVGKSGSGKSTLVNMLTGIDHPTSGMVRVNQTRIHELSESKMSLWRGRNLGIVFQFFQLLPMLSLLENVVLPMDLCETYTLNERERRALELLQMFGLEEYAHALPDAVSGGQQQSAAIARALANDAPIIIADEPTGNLDSRTADDVFEKFKDLVRQGKTIIMVTHDSSLASQTDRTLILADGELIREQLTRAFPGLPHKRLQWIDHRLRPYALAAGESFNFPELDSHGLLLVESGSLEGSLVANHQEAAIPVALQVEDVLVEVGFSQAGQSPGGLRAGRDGAQILVLPAQDLEQWLKEWPADRERLSAKTIYLQQKWGLAELPVLEEGRI
jgi:putative ABC transport system ATP-binding protein